MFPFNYKPRHWASCVCTCEGEYLKRSPFTPLHEKDLVMANIQSHRPISTCSAPALTPFSLSIPTSVFLVPEGKRYLVKPMKFVGPCKDGNLIVQIEGTIVAPDDPSAWDPHSLKNWLVFDKLKGLTIQGGGVIDGSGKKWWEQSCKINKANPCRSAPTVLTIHSSSNVRLRDLRFQNSQQMHIAVSRSIGVQVTNLQVVAPGNSPNTDGIHITASQNIQINECSIATGKHITSFLSLVGPLTRFRSQVPNMNASVYDKM